MIIYQIYVTSNYPIEASKTDTFLVFMILIKIYVFTSGVGMTKPKK